MTAAEWTIPLPSGNIQVWKPTPTKLVLHFTDYPNMSLVNGLRRLILSDVPTLGFKLDDVTLTHRRSNYELDTIRLRCMSLPLFDNRPDLFSTTDQVYILHGPTVTEPYQFVPRDGMDVIRSVMSRTVKCYTKTTTKDADGNTDTTYDPAPSQLSEPMIDIVDLYVGQYGVSQEIRAEMVPSVGCGRDHAFFIPACVSYRFLPEFEQTRTNRGKLLLSEEEYHSALLEANSKIDRKHRRDRSIKPLMDVKKSPFGDPECIELCIENAQKRMDPEWAFWHATRILNDKINTFISELSVEDSTKLFISHLETIPGQVEIKVMEEDETLGFLVRNSFLQTAHRFIIETVRSHYAEEDEERAKEAMKEEKAHLVQQLLADAINFTMDDDEITIKLKAPEGLLISIPDFEEERSLTLRVLRIALSQLSNQLDKLHTATTRWIESLPK